MTTTLLTPILEQNVGTPGIDEDVEPDAQWKENLRGRIEKELQSMADKVRQDRDSSLSVVLEGSNEWGAVMDTYNASMARVRRIAQEQFDHELKIARFERSLAMGKEVEGEEFEAFRRQQQAIWDTIKKGGAERPQVRRDSTVVSSPNQENGDSVAAPPRANGEEDDRDGPGFPFRDSRPLARAPPEAEPRPRDRTQSGGSERILGVPGSYGVRPVRSRGNSVFADFDPTATGTAPYEQGSIGRQSLGSLSRSKPPEYWLPAPSPKDNTSRTFAHATAPSLSPVSPNPREGSVNDNGGRTSLSRGGSIRSIERPSPVTTDYDPGSSLPRDRFGMLDERSSSRKGKEPEWSDHQRHPSFTQQTSVQDIYARRSDSRASIPITPGRPSVGPQTFEDQYFPQISPVTSRYGDERGGIPIRSSRRSVTSDQGSPENLRYGPPNQASARQIPNKRSVGDFNAWSAQTGSSGRPIIGPSPPGIPITSSRPIPLRPTSNGEERRRDSPSGAHGSQSPPSPFPFAAEYDIPYGTSSRYRQSHSSSPGGSVASGRRNSNGSRSVRSRSSRQEMYLPEVPPRPLETYEEQSVASDSDTGEEMDLDDMDDMCLNNLFNPRERRELAWKLVRSETRRQEALRRADEARVEAQRQAEVLKRMEEEARRKEEEVRLKELEIRQQEEALLRREAELLRREAEAKLVEERRKREEAEARLQEEIQRRQEAEKRREREEEERAAQERERRAKEDQEKREQEDRERLVREERGKREKEERERQERIDRERREKEEREREEWERREEEENSRRERQRREKEKRDREREEKERLAREEREKRQREKDEKERREKEEKERNEERERRAREQKEREEWHQRQREEEERFARERREWEETRRREAEAVAAAQAQALVETERLAAEAAAARRRQHEAELLQRREQEIRRQQEAEAQRRREEETRRQQEVEAQRRRDEEARRQREAEAEGQRAAEAAEARRRQEAEAEIRQRNADAARDSPPSMDDNDISVFQDPHFVKEQQAEFERIRGQQEQEARRRAELAKKREEEEARKQAQFTREQEEIYKRLQAEEQGRLKEQEARRRAEDIMRKKAELAKQQEDAILADVLRRSQEEHRLQEERRRRQDSVGSASDSNPTRPAHHNTSLSSSAPRPIPSPGAPFHHNTGDRSSTASSSSFSSSASFYSASSTRSGSTGYTSSASRTSTTPTTPMPSTPMPSTHMPSTPVPSTPSAPPSSKGGWKPTPSPTTPSSTTSRTSTGTFHTAFGSGSSSTYGQSSPATARPPGPQPTTSPGPVDEEEWARRQEEHARRQFEQFQREQEAQQRRAEQKAIRQLSKEEVVKLFEEHDRRWSRISSMDVLGWHSFPWPMLKQPTDPEQLTYIEIQAYVLSPHQPGDKTQKERIKDYLRKWHPDRFETKVLPKVREEEREKVKEGAGSVARHLNKILSSLSGNGENGLFG